MQYVPFAPKNINFSNLLKVSGISRWFKDKMNIFVEV